jgi:histidinol dehydrogenase
MKNYIYSTLNEKERTELTSRPAIDFNSVSIATQHIIAQVQANGDKALFNLTKRFDGVELQSLLVGIEEIDDSVTQVTEEFLAALKTAKENITRFHSSQTQEPVVIETMPGVRCFRESRAIEKVGIYVPGGTAILPSSLLMQVIPAQLAGCRQIIICTPPNKEGKIAPEILAAAKILGVEKIFKIGGAQAVAAMAYGTESIPRVYKITGPGNQYVTAAKMLLSSSELGLAIDMPAGPSEVLVIADDLANSEFIAADLLSQAEHGPDSQVVLLVTSEKKRKEVQECIDKQLLLLPRRDVAAKALGKSLSIICKSIEEAIFFSNRYAPEHLILNVSNAQKYVKLVQSAGSVFLGAYAPESVGDYASGTNHTLPTYGYARNYSGLSVDSFVKKITFQELSADGIKNIGPTVEVMASAENLFAHKNAVSLRLQSLNQ